MKNQYVIKPCPFCGNPAEIVETKPFEWCPFEKAYIIRCSNEYCIGSSLKRKSLDINLLIADWNVRRKRNKYTCDEKGYPIKEKQEDN